MENTGRYGFGLSRQTDLNRKRRKGQVKNEKRFK